MAFGLDSVVEVFASLVVVWQFGGDDEPPATAPVAVIDGFSGTVTPHLTATFAA